MPKPVNISIIHKNDDPDLFAGFDEEWVVVASNEDGAFDPTFCHTYSEAKDVVSEFAGYYGIIKIV